MKTIRISDEVWNVIAENGKFGETEDIVLRRLLEVVQPREPRGSGLTTGVGNGVGQERPYGWKERRADVRMFQRVRDGKLVLEFETGQRREWKLPAKDDAAAIRVIRDEAIDFVRENQGTEGQKGAAMRALTSRGYHVTLKGQRRERHV
jgi:hypothetical protein